MGSGYYLLDYNPGTQQWGYPRRGATLSGTAIIHTGECAMDFDGQDDSAENSARNIANRADYGSYHRYVDSDSIIRMLPWEYEAWQDSNTNPWAVGISAAVQSGRWLEIPPVRRDRIYRNLAACAAEFVTFMRARGIEVPLRRITGAQARARVPGFCAHGDSGIARTDPGVQFDWAMFFRYTAEALSGVAAMGEVTPEKEEDDEMLIIGKLKGTDQVWIGNGVTRRHVPNPETLDSYSWYARNGWLKIFKDGAVQELATPSALEALGVDVSL